MTWESESGVYESSYESFRIDLSLYKSVQYFLTADNSLGLFLDLLLLVKSSLPVETFGVDRIVDKPAGNIELSKNEDRIAGEQPQWPGPLICKARDQRIVEK